MCKRWQNNLAFNVRQIILIKKLLLQEPELTAAGTRMRREKSYLCRKDGCDKGKATTWPVHLWKSYPHLCALSSGLGSSILVLCLCGSTRPFLLVKKCTCIKGKPPDGDQCLQEPREGSLGGFAICCPLCLFEHLHLLLASPCAAAGISHNITGTHHPLFPSQLCLCLWSGTVVVFPASPSEA